MSNIIVRGVPEQLHASLKQQAKRHHRSVTKEVVSLIEAGVEREQSLDDLPPPIKLKSGYRPTIEDIEAAIAEGQE
jgi:plasmid stability protein